jgi:probable FeS assembly SUF system protein SufT
VWDTLRTCYDPEIPVNIVDLGLVYRCVLEPLEEGDKLRVVIDMTLTAPGCGMGEAIADEVCDKLLLVPRVGYVTVNLVFEPPWERSMMSEAAQLALGL